MTREEDPVGRPAADQFALLYYGLEPDYEKKLPENEFLLKYKYCRDDLRLVNPAGELIDLKGRRIDEKYYLLNADGKRVDEHGKLLPQDTD